MKAFLPTQEHLAGLFAQTGAAAQATDLARLTMEDDGFVLDSSGAINWYLAPSGCVSRLGRQEPEGLCAVRPALLLDPGEERLLTDAKTERGVTTAQLGACPQRLLDSTLRDMAQHAFADGSLPETGRSFTLPDGTRTPVYQLGAKEIVSLTVHGGYAAGYVQLSDGTCLSEGERVFVEVEPVTWLCAPERGLLLSREALFAGFSRADAEAYLAERFPEELCAAETETAADGDASYRVGEHDELSLMRAYVEANIPVFLHGLSGDGKSDRVRQLDPQALDIELVNETPETINGRAIYNEAKDEIVDIKPVWLLKLEELCEDGRLHILFFDELTNATKQTQSVIFKIVLERIVNNRWPLPENARIIAAGNDRAESTVAHDLAEPLFGRFAHLYIRTTVENWMPWAVRSRINPFVLEFLANNDLYLRTPYTGTEPNADPRRWELASRVLDASGNDFSLLGPLVGEKTAEAFVKFFRAQRELKRGAAALQRRAQISARPAVPVSRRVEARRGPRAGAPPRRGVRRVVRVRARAQTIKTRERSPTLPISVGHVFAFACT